MPRWASGWGLALCVVACGLLGAPALSRAEPPPDASLSWVRTEGAEPCLGAQELAADVEKLVGHAVWVPAGDADLSVEGYVSPGEDDRFHAVLMTSRKDGSIVGRRELTSQGDECASLREPLALVVALTVDPESGFVALPEMFDTDADSHMDSLLPPESADSAALDTPRVAPPATTTAKPARGKVREADPLGTKLDRVATRQRGTFVAPIAGLGQLPKDSGGLMLGMLGTRKSWPVGMEARFWAPRWTPNRSQAERYLFWSTQLSLYACPVWRARANQRLEGHICLGLSPNLTVMRDPSRKHAVGPGIDAELLIQAIAPTSQKFSIFLNFTLGAMLYGQVFRDSGVAADGSFVGNDPIWKTPYVRGLISAGLFFPR